MVLAMQLIPVETSVPRQRSKEMQPFGWWLKHQIDQRDWNQSDFGRRASVSPSLVSDWVNGRRTPSIQSAQIIADALDVPLDVVLVRMGLDPRSAVPEDLQRVDGLLKTVNMTPDRRVAGAGTAEIRDYLNAEAPPPPSGRWRWESIYIMMRNPVYKGTVSSGPVTVDGCHPAIVDEATWQAAQREPRRYRRRAKSANLSWLTGLVDHGCGRAMHLHAPNASNPGPFFRCASTVAEPGKPRSCHVYPTALAAHKIEAAAWQQALAALDRIGDPGSVLAAMRRAYREQAPDATRELRLAEQAVARASARRARAEELYLSGARDRAWFNAEDARAAADLDAAQAKLRDVPRPPDRRAIEVRLHQLRSLRDAAGAMTLEQRGELVALLGRVVVAGRNDVRLVLDPTVARLLKPD